ncbi:hypothetical protein [Geobacter anodireducens]|uniref:Yip1 domain-containing protein n=1 Tax=Geobacter anodireducens TaxID=1340425 RepID=A0ABR9NZF8_9BACT|nr:hypothetical protein [Geobacter anodireducens]MBE2889657.1 hypothetical protein [Geobacter anodireducens]
MFGKIKTTFSHFRKEDFSPWSGRNEAIIIFAAWAVPAFLFILLVHLLAKYRSVEYFTQAIAEGIGPHLWNVIGVFGFFLFGAALLFPSRTYLAFAANRILVNTYAIGSLMFGILFGQLVTGLSNATLEKWKLWLFGFAFVVLFLVVFIINLFTWYLSFLIYCEKGKTSFISKIEQLGVGSRIAISLLIMLLPVCLMFAER